jgi:ubiquinone biosynthesis protein Coq4
MAQETGLQAFTVAQMPAQAFTASLVSAGLLYPVIKDHSLITPTMEAVSIGWRNGKAAHPMLATKWEEMWDRSLVELRREYNITPYSDIYDFAPQLAEVAG